MFHATFPMKIFIFDLDNTIDANCMKHGPREKVMQLLDKIEQTPDWHLCVVTARRYNECDYNWNIVLKHNIPRDIVDTILRINYEIPVKDWLFFPNHSDEPTQLVNEHLLQDPRRPHIRQAYERFKRKNRDSLEPKQLDFGLLKMLQIDHIINARRDLTNEYLYPLTFFFDDALSNKIAWYFYSQHCNPDMKNLRFIGGTDKSVFGTIRQDEFDDAMASERPRRKY